MITKRTDRADNGGLGYTSVVDEVAGTPEFCPAFDDSKPHNTCGRKMNKINDWTWRCPTHGEMH